MPRRALRLLSFHCRSSWIDALRHASRLWRVARRNDTPNGVPKRERERSLSLINALFLFSGSSSKLKKKKKPHPASLTLVTVPQFWKIDFTVNSSTLDSTLPT